MPPPACWRCNRLWGAEPAAGAAASASAWRSAPTCRFSCAGATPGSRASASGSRRWSCRRRASWWSSRPQGLRHAAHLRRPGAQTRHRHCYNLRLCCKPAESRDFGFGHNDLQPVAQRLCPQVGQALEWLGAQGLARADDRLGKRGVRAACRRRRSSIGRRPAGWQVRECSNLEVHPLVGWAASDRSVAMRSVQRLGCCCSGRPV